MIVVVIVDPMVCRYLNTSLAFPLSITSIAPSRTLPRGRETAPVVDATELLGVLSPGGKGLCLAAAGQISRQANLFVVSLIARPLRSETEFLATSL